MKKFKQVVSQGRVLSPMLLSIYMNKLPLSPKGINITSYADDTTLTTSHSQDESLRGLIVPYMIFLHDWAELRKLNVNNDIQKVPNEEKPYSTSGFRSRLRF